jgi:hypothetical protein
MACMHLRSRPQHFFPHLSSCISGVHHVRVVPIASGRETHRNVSALADASHNNLGHGHIRCGRCSRWLAAGGGGGGTLKRVNGGKRQSRQTACVHEGLKQHVTARGQVLFNLCKKSVVIIEIVTVAGVGLTLTTLMSPPRDSWGMKHFYGSDWSCPPFVLAFEKLLSHTGSHTPTTSSGLR